VTIVTIVTVIFTRFSHVYPLRGAFKNRTKHQKQEKHLAFITNKTKLFSYVHFGFVMFFEDAKRTLSGQTQGSAPIVGKRYSIPLGGDWGL
jgi:hypothetical protein